MRFIVSALIFSLLSTPAVAGGCDDLRRGLDELKWATSTDEVVAAARIVKYALPSALQERSAQPPGRVNRQLQPTTDAIALLRESVTKLLKGVQKAARAGHDELVPQAISVFQRSEMASGELYYFSLCIPHRN